MVPRRAAWMVVAKSVIHSAIRPHRRLRNPVKKQGAGLRDDFGRVTVKILVRDAMIAALSNVMLIECRSGRMRISASHGRG